LEGGGGSGGGRGGPGARGAGASFLESMGRNVIVCVQIYQKLKKTKTLRRERIHIAFIA
jgi:hypothetical protein